MLTIRDFTIERTSTVITRTFDAKKFRAERFARGITLREIADRAGITTSYVCNIEKGTGRPRPDVCARLVAALEHVEEPE